MDSRILIILASVFIVTSAWSAPFYSAHRRYPIRVTRLARHPHHSIPEPARNKDTDDEKWRRPKRDDDDDFDNHDYHFDNHDNDNSKYNDKGVTGPIHTFIKTDKNANYKWGVRHHVGQKYSP